MISWFEWTNCMSEQDPMIIVRQTCVPPDADEWHGFTIPKKQYQRMQTTATYLLRPRGDCTHLTCHTSTIYSFPRWVLPTKVINAVETWAINSAADATARFVKRYGQQSETYDRGWVVYVCISKL